MTRYSRYTPDRSLLLAIALLSTGVLICGGGAYLLTSSMTVPHSGGGAVTAGASSAPAPRYSMLPGRSGTGASSIAGGGVPAWAGSGRPNSLPNATGSRGIYQVDPDFGHADLGGATASSGGGSNGGVAIADAGAPTDGGPKADGTPGPDLGVSGTATANVGGEWQSEAQALASRSRALSREIARLNREEASSGTAQREQAEQPSGEASTASSRGGAETNTPGTPSDPSQVPLGGAEYLAAAGAAYALNRLRKNRDDEEDEESDDMP